MVKSYEKQAKSKADIAKENREKNLEITSGGGGIHAGKSKDKIAKEKKKKNLDMVSKQDVKEKKAKNIIPRGKSGLDLEARKKAKEEHKEKSKGKTFKDVVIEPIKKIVKKITGKNGKAKAAEVEKGGKSPGPKEKKKLPKVSGKAREDAKRAKIREEARKPKKKEAKKQAETGTRETSYEARVKALVAKKASLSKKETADGRSEYQVQMNKLKKENKKAWKKMFKGGKLKG